MIAFKVLFVQVLLESMVILSLIYLHIGLTDFQADEVFVKVINVDGVCSHIIEHHICLEGYVV